MKLPVSLSLSRSLSLFLFTDQLSLFADMEKEEMKFLEARETKFFMTLSHGQQ